MRAGWCIAPAVLATAVASCSQAVDHVSSGDATGQYQIAFQSTATAVLSDEVEVLVFDADAPGADCLSLLVARKAKASLPEAPALLEDTGAIGTCSLGSTPLHVTFGNRSIFAVATRGGQDFLTGCAQADVEASGGVVTVYLDASPAGDLPPTTCTTLTQKCSGGC